MIRKLSSVYVLAHSGFVIRSCPMAESLFILELEFLHIRGGGSLIVFFVLMLVGTCCFILSASLCVVRPTYRASQIQTIIFGSLGKQDRPFIKVFWNQFTLRLKIQSCVNKKSSFFHFDSLLLYFFFLMV